MLRNDRRLLFYILVAVFFILGAGVLAYAQGWRIDFPRLKIQKVGAIYVRSFPSEASISIGDGPVRKNFGIFQSGTLVDNLSPGRYSVELSATDYRPWRRAVVVEPSLVSEIRYAVLVPKSAALVSPGPFADFWLVNGEVLVKDTAGALFVGNNSVAGSVPVGWSGEGRHLATFNPETGAYYWVNLERATSTNIRALIRSALRAPDAPFSLGASRGQEPRLVLFSSSSLFFLDPESATAHPAVRNPEQPIAAADFSRFWLAWITFNAKENQSNLFVQNILSGDERGASRLFPGKTVKAAWGNDNLLGVLQDDRSFYIYDATAHTLRKTASDVKDFFFSESASRVATLEHGSIEIFTLGGEERYWRFNLPEVETISTLEWYADEEHLFVTYPDQVRFLDLGDSSQENVITVAETRRGRYDSGSNRFYFLGDEGLFFLEFPK